MTGTIGRPNPSKDDIRREVTSLERPLRARGVRSAAIFGSAARNKAGAESDIDIMIDVDPGTQFDLVDLVGVKLFLEEHLGRPVDIVMREALRPLIREQVLHEAEPIF